MSSALHPLVAFAFFFFNDTATTEIYTLSLHDALPISLALARGHWLHRPLPTRNNKGAIGAFVVRDRKSTRLNSSHVRISYAVFCLKKKKKQMGLAAAKYRTRHDYAEGVYLRICDATE